MKKIARGLIICLLLVLTAMLTGCGEKQEPAQSTAAVQTPAAEQTAPAEEKQAAAEEEPEKAPEQTPSVTETEPSEAPEASGALETALSFVDQDAQLLLDALGEPNERQYEASCSGPGDDGIWLYDEITVFTYRENGVETIVDAE